MDLMSANSCEVQVTRPALTLHRRTHLYNSCPEKQAGVRERICGWSLKCNKFSRGRVWEAMAARLPILDWLPKYKLRQAFLGDLIAGLTVGVVAVPQGMAYAMLAHLPPITGLYAGVISGLVYMLLGTSHHISLGVVGSLGVLTAKAIGNVVSHETVPTPATAPATAILSTTPTLAQGLQSFTADGNSTSDNSGYSSVEVAVGQVFSVLLSHMIVSAFTTSVAYDIMFSQLKSLLGIPLPRYTGAFKSFYVSSFSAAMMALNAAFMLLPIENGRTIRDLSLALLTANPTVVGVSAVCITLLVANNEILKPRLKKVCPVPVPVELLVMVAGTVVSRVLNLEEEQSVTVIGHVPKGFPMPSVPHLELVPQLLVHSFIIAVIGYVSAISMAKIIAKRKGYVIQATQELYAHGITNFVGSFFSCAPVSVSLSRSVIQEEVGGVTGLASLFSCSALMIMLYSIGPLFSALPNCVLSAVILVSFRGLFLQVKDLAKLWSSSRLDAAIWLATFVVSVVVGLDYGLLAGLAASAVVLLLRAQRPPALHLGHVPFTDLYLDLKTYHKAVEVPGVKIFQFGGPLHFGNASYFHSSLFSVTGLDLAAAKPASASRVQLMDAGEPEDDKETLFGVTVNNAGVGKWCISHSCAHHDDSSSFYDMRSDETRESGASQASTSHTDVSEDDTSHSDTENGDTGSDACLDCDPDQDNTSQGTVSQVSTQDTTCDSMSPHKPTDVTLINIDGEAAKNLTCFSFQVCHWLVLDLSLVSFVDTTGASMMKQLHRDLQTTGVTLCLASASDKVVEALERCGVLEEISRDLVFHSTHDAITTITCPRHSPTTR
ncbi:Solute carrier family 26 member 6 [Portunus trituberculatus]|uniref:Solute carrier family 26 member 6 n=1 Tax=Portunus trituberculatus TaxID=210409 RepID=A0A5B7D7B8_PORTR|nr:Solute carrier family 26 member 6 [Portunus trituberculatus]